MNLATIGNRVSRLFSRGGETAVGVAISSAYAQRFDITDHGVELPDLAEFPECREMGEVSLPEKLEPLTASLAAALRTADLEAFLAQLGRLQSHMTEQCGFGTWELEILDAQIRNVGRMAAVYLQHKQERDVTVRNDLPGSATHDALVEDGVAAKTVDTADVRSILAAEIDELISREVAGLCRPGEGYDRSKMLFPADNPVLFEALRTAFLPHQIFSAASKYHRTHDLDFKHACLHVCTPADTHFTQCLQDCQTTSRLVGLHFDPKPAMKIILYLNEVASDSGPFCFIPRSHRWRFDELEMVFGKGTSTGNYLNSPAHRRVAISFPRILRKTSLMGRLVLDGTPLSDKLLNTEVAYTSDMANCMVFDAGHGWHRGGICRSGIRINLQIALQ